MRTELISIALLLVAVLAIVAILIVRDARWNEAAPVMTAPRLQCANGGVEAVDVMGPAAPTPAEALEAFLQSRPGVARANFSPYSFSNDSRVYWHKLDDGTIDATVTVRLSKAEQVWTVSTMQRCKHPQ